MRKKKITPKVRGFIFFGKLSQSIVLHFMAHQALHKSFHIFLCSPLLEGESAFPDWESQGQSLTHLPLNLFFTPPLLRSLSHHRVGVLVALPSKLFPRLWLPLLYGFLLGLANGRIIERLKYMGKRQTEEAKPKYKKFLAKKLPQATFHVIHLNGNVKLFAGIRKILY